MGSGQQGNALRFPSFYFLCAPLLDTNAHSFPEPMATLFSFFVASKMADGFALPHLKLLILIPKLVIYLVFIK